MNTYNRDILFAIISGLAAIAALLAMPLLVASPKLLFGRSLSAIPPSLFPYVTLTLVALLSASLLLVSWRSLMVARLQYNNTSSIAEETVKNIENNWWKKGAFFVFLVSYGLLLKPVGFLISSFLVISATSVMLGNRHWLQIVFFALIAPVCLYLIATRLMLVSLPELNPIELFYSHTIAWLRGNITS